MVAFPKKALARITAAVSSLLGSVAAISEPETIPIAYGPPCMWSGNCALNSALKDLAKIIPGLLVILIVSVALYLTKKSALVSLKNRILSFLKRE